MSLSRALLLSCGLALAVVTGACVAGENGDGGGTAQEDAERGRTQIDAGSGQDTGGTPNDQPDAGGTPDQGGILPDVGPGGQTDTGPGPGTDTGPGPDTDPQTDTGPGMGPDTGGTTLVPGQPCAVDSDCGADGVCVPEETDQGSTGFVGGYCLTSCADTDCPTGSTCFLLGSDQVPLCILDCTSDAECRLGYVCDADDTCWPGCNATRGCPGELSCSADQICEGEGGTVDPGPGGTGGACSATNPLGTCSGGQICIDGACSDPPPCDDDAHEPNNTMEQATPLPLGEALVGGRCAGDDDWFEIDVPAGQLVSFLAQLPSTVDIDVYAYRADGTPLGGRVEGADPAPSWSKSYETTQEGFGFYAGNGPGTYYVRVTGASAGSAGSYSLSATATPWSDGQTCSGEGFSSTTCTGVSGGSQTLLPFPFYDAGDDFIDAGYYFDSLSNYRYLRRETMMAIRYALSEVEREFPGTGALGMVDMCQRNGITPGYDIGSPRHPESTHDQGGNIDVAYYQTVSDNHARVVCDAAGTNVVSGAFCADSAVSTHIADLRRNVYFVVALTRTGRLRVVGLDRVIGPLMLQEAADMVDDGVITPAEYQAFDNYTTWGDGWPYHHHHMHVSMQWL